MVVVVQQRIQLLCELRIWRGSRCGGCHGERVTYLSEAAMEQRRDNAGAVLSCVHGSMAVVEGTSYSSVELRARQEGSYAPKLTSFTQIRIRCFIAPLLQPLTLTEQQLQCSRHLYQPSSLVAVGNA